VSAPVVSIHGAGRPLAAAEIALSAAYRHLDRCKLATNTVKAYKRQTRAFVTWLAERTADHPDAFADVVGAEAAVTAWRRHLIEGRAKPATVNQALAAVMLMYAHAGCASWSSAPASPSPASPTPSRPPSRAPSSARPPAAASGTRRSSRCCCTPAPASKNAPGSNSRTSPSPPAPAPSDCTARATKSAPSHYPPSAAPASPPGWTSAAANPARSGSANEATSPTPASPRSSWPSATTPASPAYAPTGSATPSPPASAKAAPTPPRSKPCSVTRLWTPRRITPDQTQVRWIFRVRYGYPGERGGCLRVRFGRSFCRSSSDAVRLPRAARLMNGRLPPLT
jgi:hypothetical protein